MKTFYSALGAATIFWGMHSQTPQTIQKIFVHITGHDEQTVEMGNLIFYCENDLHVDVLKKVVDGDFETRTYFLPMAKINPEVKLAEIETELATIPSHICSVAITQELKPITGVKIVFRFNMKMVDVLYDTFSALTLKKGIIFRIYNKVVLNKLQHAHDDQAMLTLAHHAGARTVVIDCGHGGDDDGAIGCGNIKEKDINLTIGLLVAQNLKKKGVNALLTRATDVTLPLKDRVVFANKVHADLFVSIHSNAAPNHNASGVETFGVVPLFTASPNDPAHTVHVISQRLVQHRVNKSMDCAAAIQNSLVAYIKKIHHEVKDRAVKRAPLLVLLGTTMPAALVEVGFVSNPEESLLLANPTYQNYLAHGITDGISCYLQSVA